MKPSAHKLLVAFLLLVGISVLCFTGEWFALHTGSLLWRHCPQLAVWKAGSSPFYAVCLAELALVAVISRRTLQSRFWPERWNGTGLLGLLGALLLGPLGLEGLFRWHLPHWHAPLSPLVFVSGAVLDPLAEEWAFRGILWRAVERALGSGKYASLAATALTSLLFGLWHIPFQNPGADVAGVVRANIEFGLALALARLRLKAFGPGVVIHALGNAFYLLTG